MKDVFPFFQILWILAKHAGVFLTQAASERVDISRVLCKDPEELEERKYILHEVFVGDR
jgi:hypothetical protein